MESRLAFTHVDSTDSSTTVLVPSAEVFSLLRTTSLPVAITLVPLANFCSICSASNSAALRPLETGYFEGTTALPTQISHSLSSLLFHTRGPRSCF